MHDYDYAVMRLVPDVRTEAFVNVGVAMHSRTARFLAFRYRLPDAALRAAPGEAPLFGLDVARLVRFCDGLACAHDAAPGSGPIGLLTPSERFHWLTSPRSTVVQWSPVRGGRTSDPAACFEALVARYVPGGGLGVLSGPVPGTVPGDVRG